MGFTFLLFRPLYGQMDQRRPLFAFGQTVQELQQCNAFRHFFCGCFVVGTAVIADFLPPDHHGPVILLGKRQHIVVRKPDTAADFIGNGNAAFLAENTVQLTHRHHPLRQSVPSGIRRSRDSSKDSPRSPRCNRRRRHHLPLSG